MKVVVFGGLGFIGTNLVELLSLSGHDVIVVHKGNSIFTNGNFIHFNKISDLETFLCDTEILIDLVYTTNPKTSFENPILDISSNLPALIDRFNIALKLKKLNKYIFVSSGGTVYGESHGEEISENGHLNPISPYGITKLACEKYGFMYSSIFNLPFIVVRPSNAYGIGQKIGTGQGFIMAAIHASFNNSMINIYGKNGTIRDYIYISDLCYGLLAIIQKSEVGDVFNIGSGVGYSNFQVLEILKNILISHDVTLQYSTEKERKFDVKCNILNIEKIKNVTGWVPSINLNDGINELVNWYIKKYVKI